MVVEMGRDRGAEHAELGQGRLGDPGGQVLIGEIDLSLEMGEGADQALPPVLVDRGQPALHLAQGLAALGGRIGLD